MLDKRFSESIIQRGRSSGRVSAALSHNDYVLVPVGNGLCNVLAIELTSS